MKLGDRIVVVPHSDKIAQLFCGKTGVIVGEKITNSQFAMVTGICETRLIIKLDNPVTIKNSRLDGVTLMESALALQGKGEVI